MLWRQGPRFFLQVGMKWIDLIEGVGENRIDVIEGRGVEASAFAF